MQEGQRKKRQRRSGGSTVYNPKSQRLIFEWHENRCVHCGIQFEYEQLTRDHIIPISRGGEIGWTNIVPSCSICNAERDNTFFLSTKRDRLLEKARQAYEYMLRQRGLNIVRAYEQKLRAMGDSAKQVRYLQNYLDEARQNQKRK